MLVKPISEKYMFDKYDLSFSYYYKSIVQIRAITPVVLMEVHGINDSEIFIINSCKKLRKSR